MPSRECSLFAALRSRLIPARRGWRWRLAAASLAVLMMSVAVVSFVIGYRAHLQAPTPSYLLYDRHGEFLAELQSGEAGYGYWPVREVPARVAAATLAIEDRRFWDHPGVDPWAVARAAWQNLTSGERVSGASTLAMQVARMQHPAARTYFNKALEALTAIALTARYGRRGVLAQYLRIVPYGNRIHGIRYAARRYLAKPVADLSWAEIAFLSAIPQAPGRMNPFDPAGRYRAIRRGERILAALRERDVISASEYRLARLQIGRIRVPERAERPAVALHAILRIAAELQRKPVARRYLDRPIVKTTLDLRLQRKVARQTRQLLARWRRRGAGNAAAIVVDRQSNGVLAWVGSADYFNKTWSGAIDYARVPRSPGSTLKPFIYALALDRGTITPATVLDDLPLAGLPIRNADRRFLGPLLPRQALANSRNVPAIRVVRSLGVDETYGFLHLLRLHPDAAPPAHYGLGLAIGAMPVTLEQLVSAYTVLADDGVQRPLRWFVDAPSGEHRRLLSTAVAREVGLFLSDPTARLPSFPRMGTTEYPFPVAVKTGTSQGYRDAWTVAYSTRYLVGVWTGDPDERPMNHLSGAGSAADLAQRIMLSLHADQSEGLQDLSFPKPPGYVPVRLCATSGELPGALCQRTFREWLAPGQVPHAVDKSHVLVSLDRRSGRPTSAATPRGDRVRRVYFDLPPRYADATGPACCAIRTCPPRRAPFCSVPR
ncbi:MAG: penicillin-binding protein 1C [Gammaproteobacteria bacterium]